ncbi:hypothetical protein GALMADRAFT_230143 [Galerina marginata CBS 339.88]|uniref:DUF6533 domain-containing protein n=1 Tax=Galerina marginata (strain CBS 339.88) TaxID=685588 RepID=A0A067SJF0_GALM3|nr:hypothetical protein GALMADRAFT_230143 [Galerina marginata CBS 339.88]
MVNHRDPSISHPIWETTYARQYISLVSVVCLVWEHILIISQEYTFVWKSRLVVTKCLYLGLRYFAIGFLLANHYASCVLLSKVPLNESTCLSWFIFQAAYLQVIQTLFEVTLLVRVWALYDKSRRIGLILSSLYLFECVIMLHSIVGVTSRLQFDDTCLVMETPTGAYLLAFTPLAMQGLIWSMIWYKQINPSPWFRSGGPIGTLMFRDGLVSFLLLSSIIPVCLSYSVYVHDLTDSVWTVLVTIYSIGGCRTIMNMQRLKIPQTASAVELAPLMPPSCTTTGVNISRMVDDDDDDDDGTRAEFPI